MDKLKLKKCLLDECLKKHNNTAQTYISAMAEAQQSANDYGNPEDWFDTYKSDLLNKRDMLSQQLKKILEEIKVLERIDISKENTVIGFGSIVYTEDQQMFVSVGLGKIEVNGESFFAISPLVPIFNAFRNLKKGDSFEFRGKKSKITDVF